MKDLITEIQKDNKKVRKSFYRLPTKPNVIKPRAHRPGKVKYIVRKGVRLE